MGNWFKRRTPNNEMKTTLQVAVVAALISIIPTTRGDVITDWNDAALQTIRENRTNPPRASRALAMLHLAMYEAINGLDRTHEPYRLHYVPKVASKQAAASAAARKVLSSLFPTNTPPFTALHNEVLSRVPRGPRKFVGIAWGNLVADRILKARALDGSEAVVASPVGTNVDSWVATPPGFVAWLLPEWATVVPFGMDECAQFRPSGPPPLDSARWAADFNEVKALGAAQGSTRTADQSEIAQFWADGGGTETPPGHWNSIAQDVAAAAGNTLEENARLFALLNMAMADAAICAWDAKFAYNNWRPVTAIRNADLDGNDLTEPDVAWSSFIGTPPFPDYVSGHSTFSGAAATVLALFYGTDKVSFTTGSDFLPGVTRSFTSFSQAADEAARSRVYGGIHFQFASDDGLIAGMGIGEWTFTHYFQRRPNIPFTTGRFD